MECGFVFPVTSTNSTGKSSLQFHPNAQCKKTGIRVNTWQFALYIILPLRVDCLIWFCFSSFFCKGATARFGSWPLQQFASRCTCALLTATILLCWPATRSPLDGFFRFQPWTSHRFSSINFSLLYSPGSLNSWIRKGLSRPVIL